MHFARFVYLVEANRNTALTVTLIRTAKYGLGNGVCKTFVTFGYQVCTYGT